MAKVDFYILPAAEASARWQFACRLIEKAYRLNNTVHVHTTEQDAATKFDELLWTWRDGSFVPHELAGASAAERPPVTIGHSDEHLQTACDLLINLSDEVPATIGPFPRVAEIVTSDDNDRRLSRARYARYREQGHTLDTHKL
ncbi:MAG: DNA polymerase III subunit chi [Woeseia sp.]